MSGRGVHVASPSHLNPFILTHPTFLFFKKKCHPAIYPATLREVLTWASSACKGRAEKRTFWQVKHNVLKRLLRPDSLKGTGESYWGSQLDPRLPSIWPAVLQHLTSTYYMAGFLFVLASCWSLSHYMTYCYRLSSSYYTTSCRHSQPIFAIITLLYKETVFNITPYNICNKDNLCLLL